MLSDYLLKIEDLSRSTNKDKRDATYSELVSPFNTKLHALSGDKTVEIGRMGEDEKERISNSGLPSLDSIITRWDSTTGIEHVELDYKPISRKHGIVCPTETGEFEYRDIETNLYGTIYNGNPMEKGAIVTLKHGDALTFGGHQKGDDKFRITFYQESRLTKSK